VVTRQQESFVRGDSDQGEVGDDPWCSALGFRNLTNYIARSLLESSAPTAGISFLSGGDRDLSQDGGGGVVEHGDQVRGGPRCSAAAGGAHGLAVDRNDPPPVDHPGAGPQEGPDEPVEDSAVGLAICRAGAGPAGDRGRTVMARVRTSIKPHRTHPSHTPHPVARPQTHRSQAPRTDLSGTLGGDLPPD